VVDPVIVTVFLGNLSVKEFWNRSTFFAICVDQKSSVLFFETHCILYAVIVY